MSVRKYRLNRVRRTDQFAGFCQKILGFFRQPMLALAKRLFEIEGMHRQPRFGGLALTVNTPVKRGQKHLLEH